MIHLPKHLYSHISTHTHRHTIILLLLHINHLLSLISYEIVDYLSLISLSHEREIERERNQLERERDILKYSNGDLVCSEL